MGKRWLVAGVLASVAGVSQAAEVQLFGIHTPATKRWAVYARVSVVDGTSGLSSIAIDVLNNTVDGVGTATVKTSAVTLPQGVSKYTDSTRFPEETEGVGYGFWVRAARDNGTITSEGAREISAAQMTFYTRGSTSGVPYRDLILPNVGINAGIALQNDTTGGHFKTAAGMWGYPVQVASGTYEPVATTGTGARIGLTMAYSDPNPTASVNLLRWNATTQDYELRAEAPKQATVIDARNYTLGQTNAGDSTVLAGLGDADLNGRVNFDDLFRLATHYNQKSKTWFEGDFDLNGRVNFDDLLILATHYNTAVPSGSEFSSTFEQDMATAFAAVPEPAMLGWVAAGLALVGRRRK